MKHTNSARGTGGQFARSDGPKAKRIEVWLQPQALDLLDTLCKQWNVGRGKAISHLICNGPVAPAAWLEVDSKPPPTPSAPPAPEPPAPTTSDQTAEAKPTAPPIFKVGDQVGLVGFEDDPTPLGTIESIEWMAEPQDSNDGELTHPPGWLYELSSGSTQHERMLIPFVAPPAPTPEPEPQPEPTPIGREEAQQLFDQIAAQGRERWEKITAEAKRIGITAKQLERILPLLKLSAANLPLSPEAVQAVHQELERGQRQTGAHQRVHAERLATINKATPNLFADLADRCGSVELGLRDGKVAIDYLLRRLPDLGLKPYRKLCAGLWQQLAQAVQWADLKSDHLSSVPARRALFWGVVLRLDHLGTDVPTDSDRFLEWCQFTVHQEHADRRKDHQAGKLFDLLSDRLTTDRAREILGLPEAGTELTRKAINDAYRDLARQHHPDTGGDPARFQRITEARKRLLLAFGG